MCTSVNIANWQRFAESRGSCGPAMLDASSATDRLGTDSRVTGCCIFLLVCVWSPTMSYGHYLKFLGDLHYSSKWGHANTCIKATLSLTLIPPAISRYDSLPRPYKLFDWHFVSGTVEILTVKLFYVYPLQTDLLIVLCAATWVHYRGWLIAYTIQAQENHFDIWRYAYLKQNSHGSKARIISTACAESNTII